ncbi:MAG: 16S rRNA (cytosine(1402)-N(4))-methyltransferase RsmH [Candidatus Saganbacteria bacterium]|nr:16S rRNA (cytosine(1402)-N(4))-methyltransferase RsmH [Candidatus Saganbacteria bacterium]
MTYHTSVLLKETIGLLNPRPAGFWVDATAGAGGHSAEILKRIVPGGKLILLDKDSDAIKEAEKNLREYDGHTIFVNDSFSDLRTILFSMNIASINGALFDLGVSSFQIDTPEKGFSFMREGPLDMRMDKRNPLTAGSVVNDYREEELVNIIREFGEERFAKRIASNIVKHRPLNTTKELAAVIQKSVPFKNKIDSVVRVFQAVRIEVNGELDDLKSGLKQAAGLLEKGGRIAVLSYHSLEDRIVKNFFREEASGCICDKRMPACTCGHQKSLDILTKKPVPPSDDEIKANPRSRSAKLRAAEKI